MAALTFLALIVVCCSDAMTLPFTTTTTTTVTTPPMICLTEHGDHLFPGQSKTYGGGEGCQYCTCHTWGPYAQCYYGDCLPPMCVDYTLSPGACCYTCPNGKNCRIPSTGEVITADNPVSRDGQVCRCPTQPIRLPGTPSPEDTVAICVQDTTIPPSTSPRAPVGRR